MKTTFTVQDLAAEEEELREKIESNLAPASDSGSSAEAALAEADRVLSTVTSEEDKAEYVKKLVKQQEIREQERKEREQAALDWEIREIQKDIEEERKRWDGVWSDEEGEGAETEAIFKDQKRRNDVLQAVIDEVQKTNKKDEESKLDKYNKKGEGWKRLQLIAESRVHTSDPDQLNKYPNHKFPLRDQ